MRGLYLAVYLRLYLAFSEGVPDVFGSVPRVFGVYLVFPVVHSIALPVALTRSGCMEGKKVRRES